MEILVFSGKWFEGDYNLAYSLIEFEGPRTRAFGERGTVNKARLKNGGGMAILRSAVPGHFRELVARHFSSISHFASPLSIFPQQKMIRVKNASLFSSVKSQNSKIQLGSCSGVSWLMTTDKLASEKYISNAIFTSSSPCYQHKISLLSIYIVHR
jgi:hypothetical protein